MDWIADYLTYPRERAIAVTVPDATAEDRWVEHVGEVASHTLYPRAASWYMGANIPGKPRVFIPYAGGVGAYREICDKVGAEGYSGFVHHSAPDRAEGGAAAGVRHGVEVTG